MIDRNQHPELLSASELAPAVTRAGQVLAELDRALLGRQQLHRMVLAAILSRGHVLFEGLPGVGKTMLVKRLGEVLGLDFKRVQFTPDLMPGDILGAHILQENDSGGRELEFRPGPVFTNILLADEINRASPKTQSALLEAMQEAAVTLLGETRPLPQPFFVLASQNPVELEGTYPLPEAQLDRFLFKLVLDTADTEVLEAIITGRRRGELPAPQVILSSADLQELLAAMDKVFLPRAVAAYIARLVSATHPTAAEAPAPVQTYVSYGASPRAAIAIAEAARAVALIASRPTVGFEDVRHVAAAVINHRLILGYRARIDRVDGHDLVEALIAELDPAGLDLPAEVTVTAE
jgi:MoxR-like ATPase